MSRIEEVELTNMCMICDGKGNVLVQNKVNHPTWHGWNFPGGHVEKGEYVKLIFDLYLGGQSVLGIIKELEKRKILSPTGKEKWCKRTIDVMLSNEKYTGDVKLLKSGNSEVHYLSSDNNPAIISKETFEAVQIDKARRSNVVKSECGNQRKNKKYSSKTSLINRKEWGNNET